MTTHHTAWGTITLRVSGILVVAPAHVKVDVAVARDMVEQATRLLGARRAPVLIDLRMVGELTREARAVVSTQAPFALAQALWVGSPFTRIVANMFMRLSPPDHPTRMFTSEEEAVSWLETFLA